MLQRYRLIPCPCVCLFEEEPVIKLNPLKAKRFVVTEDYKVRRVFRSRDKEVYEVGRRPFNLEVRIRTIED